MRRLALLLLAAALAGLAVFAWSQHSARVVAERSLGLDAARMVDARFVSAAAIEVGTLTGKVVAGAEFHGRVFTSRQTTISPATVEYFVDLRRIGKSSYFWNPSTKSLLIEIPDVSVGTPNIDASAGVTRQEGLFISREAGVAMARQIAERSAARADHDARDPANLAQARANARIVVERLARAPLAAAGLRYVRVAVVFPWEPKPGVAPLTERWDESRRIGDVLTEHR